MALSGPAVALASPAYAASAELTSPLGDPELLQILSHALAYDADSATEAIATSHNIRVKGMADDILRDAVQLNHELVQQVAKSGLVAASTSESQHLDLRCKQDLRDLRATYGRAFDHVYLKQQVEAQYAFIALLDQGGEASALQGIRTKARLYAARHLLFAQQLIRDGEAASVD
jgi:predicted outer membrane protein